MIESIITRIKNEIFIRGDEPFFTPNDKPLGLDKLWHLLRHIASGAIGYALGGGPVIVGYFDTLLDFEFEYKDYCRGKGFSLFDFFAGRLGFLIVTCFFRIMGWL